MINNFYIYDYHCYYRLLQSTFQIDFKHERNHTIEMCKNKNTHISNQPNKGKYIKIKLGRFGRNEIRELSERWRQILLYFFFFGFSVNSNLIIKYNNSKNETEKWEIGIRHQSVYNNCLCSLGSKLTYVQYFYFVCMKIKILAFEGSF